MSISASVPAKAMISGATLTKVMIVPALLFLLILFYFPLFNIAGLSVNAPQFSTVHYERFLSNPTMIMVGLRTLAYSGLVTLFCLLLGYPLAVFVSRMVKQGRHYLLVCVVLPYLTSLLVRTYAWMILLSDNGLINSLLLSIGIIDRPLPLLYTTFGAMIGMVHLMLPLMVLPIYAVVHGMNPEQMRAARALGGGPLRSFIEVFLPQTVPGVKAGCILVFAVSLGFYITPAALGGPQDLMLSNIIADLVESLLDFGYASAISIVLLAATLAVYLLAGGGLGGVAGGESQSAKPKGKSIGSLLGRMVKAFGNAAPVMRFQQQLWDRNLNRSVQRGLPVHLLWYGLCTMVLLFLILPSIVVVIMSFTGDDTLGFPPTSWSLRWYQEFLSDETMTGAAVTSFWIALGSSILALALGVAASYALVRGNIRNSQVLYTLILAPMIVPSVVAAVGTYKVFAEWGIIGSTLGVLLAHTPGSLAYVVIILSGTFTGLDKRLEQASASLGASRLRTMFLIVLPLVAPGILAAGIFSFIHSFDEIVITSFVAGVTLQTLPQQIWLIIQYEIDPQIAAISTLVMILPIIALPFFRRR